MMYNFKNKDDNVRQLNNYMLAKTLSMFEYEDLPETIPNRELEYLLQVNGYAFITEVDGELYAFHGSIGGVVDVYNNPTQITINNVALKFNKTLSIKDDGVLIRNDDMFMGLMPLYNKQNTMLIENDINMVLHGYNTRIKTLISASDDKTKENADAYLKKIIDGEVGVVGENALFNGVRVQANNGTQANSITTMTEYHQYIKASLYNEIGLSANFNMKRERLTSGEVEQGEDSLFPFVYNMMKNRNTAVDAINEKYDLNIKIDFGSVWYLKDIELVDNIVGNPRPLDDLKSSDEPLEPSDEPLEPSDEPITNHDEPLENPPLDDKTLSQAETVNDAIDLLQDENLTDEDIEVVELLIKELEDKDDE